MFVEYIEHTQTHTNNIIHESELKIRVARDYEAYATLFPYSKGVFDHLKLSVNEDGKPTLSGFEGDVYCKALYFDIDCEENPSASFKSTRELINRLINKYGLKPEHILVFFSGNKGFHVGISAKHFGGFEPCNELPYQIRRLAERITDGIEYVDSSIYNLNRFFRLPFSRHAKSGLYKVPISIDEIKTLNILKIRELAKEPRIDFQFEKVNQYIVNNLLLKEWTLSKVKPEIAKVERDLLMSFPVDQETIFQKAVELTNRKKEYGKGERNNYIFLLASWCNDLGFGEKGDNQLALERITLYLGDEYNENFSDMSHSEVETTIDGVYRRSSNKFGQKTSYIKEETKFTINEKTKLYLVEKALNLSNRSTLSRTQIAEYILALNATKKFPVDDNEVYKIVNEACQRQPDRHEDDYGHTIPELATEYYVSIANAKRSSGLGLPLIDKIEDYDYHSKVIAIVGKGGTKKSMLLKEILMHTAINGERGIYSTMEDTRLGQFKRIFNSSFKPKTINVNTPQEMKVGAISVLKKLIKSNPEKAKIIIEKNSNILYERYLDRIIIDDKTAMTPDDYEHFLEKCIRKYGSIDKLGIDGLSMMDGKGNEIDLAILNSKKVKAIANKYNLCVPLLIHVPNNVSRMQRELYDHCRGGAKVTDNADIFISLSQVIDPDKERFGEPEYSKDLVYVSYYGKRTTGERADFILKLNPYSLRFEQTDYDPKDFNF